MMAKTVLLVPVLQIIICCALFSAVDATPYLKKVGDLLKAYRNRRQVTDETRSWKYTRHAIDVLKVDLNNNDLYFCRGDPFRGIQCPEEPFCSAWNQICDGEQICALEQREECLNRSAASYGRVDVRLCDGDENPKWCHWKYQAPIRCGEDLFLSPSRKKVRVLSPRYPDIYPGDYFCYWTVSVPQGHTLSVNFLRFDTEPNYDLLSMGTGFNRENARSTIIFKHSGPKKPSPSKFDVLANTVWITFKSDDWENFKGFSIEVMDMERKKFGVTATNPFNLEPMRDCGGKILMKPDEETVVQSPGYPDFYPNNAECEWVVSTQEGMRIRVHFETFDVEEEEDHLSVGNGVSSRRAPILYRYSSRTAPTDIISRGSDVWLKFVSSLAVARKGFKAVFTEQPITDCGGIFRIPSTGKLSFGSPDYPNEYPAITKCLWQFRSSSDRRIHIAFVEFDTEYSFDRVRVGNSFEPNANLTNVEIDHSGNELPGSGRPGDLTFESAGPVAWVDFKSDEAYQGTGFRFNVYSEEASPWLVEDPDRVPEEPGSVQEEVITTETEDELPDIQLQDQEIEDPTTSPNHDQENNQDKVKPGDKKPKKDKTRPATEAPTITTEEPSTTPLANTTTRKATTTKKTTTTKASTTSVATTDEATTPQEGESSEDFFSYSSSLDRGFSTSSSAE